MIRHRAFVAQVPVSGGAPDLELPAGAEYWCEWQGLLWHAVWNAHYLVAIKLGTIGSDVVVVGVGDKEILLGLAHLEAKVELLRTAWQDGTKRTWLLAHGMQEVGGQPVAPIMYSGDNAQQLGSNYEEA